jgi:hypothetical protein
LDSTISDQIMAEVINTKKSEENLNKLNYKEYQRVGVDYFNHINKIYQELMTNVQEITDLTVTQSKEEELKLKLYSILNSHLSNLKKIFEEKSASLQNKYKKLLENVNLNMIIKDESLKDISNNMQYLDFGYKLKDFSVAGYYFLKKALNDNPGGKFRTINNLLHKYGYVDKNKALVNLFILKLLYRIFVIIYILIRKME